MDYCSIASGSSGNCTFAGTENTSILVDAGIPGRRIEEGLRMLDRKPGELDGILVTHEHIDHIKSIGVLCRKYRLPAYGTRGTLNYILGSSSMGRLDPALFHVIREDEVFRIGDLDVHPFHICHDAAQPVGYRLGDGKSTFAVATDIGSYDEYTVSMLSGLDGLLLEANHDVNMLQVGRYPYMLKRRILGDKGHLSNVSSGQLLSRVLNGHMKGIFLGLRQDQFFIRVVNAHELRCSLVGIVLSLSK